MKYSAVIGVLTLSVLLLVGCGGPRATMADHPFAPPAVQAETQARTATQRQAPATTNMAACAEEARREFAADPAAVFFLSGMCLAYNAKRYKPPEASGPVYLYGDLGPLGWHGTDRGIQDLGDIIIADLRGYNRPGRMVRGRGYRLNFGWGNRVDPIWGQHGAVIYIHGHEGISWLRSRGWLIEVPDPAQPHNEELTIHAFGVIVLSDERGRPYLVPATEVDTRWVD